jgi:[glutamine synthetase] adenylyltransferase / [glutamine synthetase]-adenylyl-L-tyrosine phosphorylase
MDPDTMEPRFGPRQMSSPAHSADGALAQRITSAPPLAAADAAQARMHDWLGEIAGTAAGKTLARLMAAHPRLGALIAGLADGSPYLWELIRVEPARLVGLLESEPARRFDEVVAGAKRAVAAARDQAEVMRLLRRMKAEGALLIALADIGGAWPLAEVLERQTALADAAVAAAVDYLLADARRSGKLRVSSDEPAPGSGYIVLAMGKMGAGELNYSSDIDLMVFYDGDALVPETEPAPFYVRLTRTLVKLLQERTSDGYVFRADLRLRPDPASTHIAVSTAAALDYYEGRGQNWERAALIKARACAGDIAAGEALLADLSPFVWRKYLDFAAVADIHAMKRQIHAYRGHDEIAVEGHNIKLGRGGIREIEFFVQTQQLIAGGRNPELRMRGTLETLDALSAGGWIGAAVRDDLAAAYHFLRVVENRLQMVADEQTHALPSDRDGLERFARFAGFPGRDAFAEALLAHLRNVQRHYATLFENAPEVEANRRSLHFPPAADDHETLGQLGNMGFRQPLEISALARRWGTPAHDSLKGEFARAQLAQIVPVLLRHFAQSSHPDAAVIAFDRFLAGLHGGGRLFSLLRQNPDLIALIALVLGTAPRLADSLAQFPEVMDAVIDPSFFGALPDESALALALERSLRQARSYEDLLDRIRIFAQEQMFLVGTRVLSGTASAEQAGEAFARLADVVIRALHRAVEENFAHTHGRVAGQESAILALGKLGGREMAANSDLDLIVVYDFDPERPESSGPRSLYGAQYFSRLTQRVISALTAQTNHGLLYQVDMRLRPSGRSGPVATQIDGFASYQENEAWTWEHMALTRARVVSASRQFAARVEEVIREVLCRPRDREAVAADVVDMRNAIAADKGDRERWNLKYVAGGLIDIEFIAQYLQLVHAARTPEILDTSTLRVLDKASRLGLLAAEDAEVLRPAARLYHDLTQILRLALPGPFDPEAAGPGLLALLARAGDVPDFARLDAYMGELQTKVRASFNRILGKSDRAHDRR